MKKYEVAWYDAHFNSGVTRKNDVSDKTPPYIIRTVGYFIGENKIDFKIAQEYHLTSKRFDNIMSIPKGCIISKKRIKT